MTEQEIEFARKHKYIVKISTGREDGHILVEIKLLDGREFEFLMSNSNNFFGSDIKKFLDLIKEIDGYKSNSTGDKM
jgi:hypothetical protein